MALGRPARAVLAATTTGLVLAGAAACSDGPTKDPAVLTVWNLDGQPDRIEAITKLNEKWTASSGIRVKEVAVEEAQLPSLMASAAVSDTLPDLIQGLPLALVQQLHGQKLLDPAASTKVVDGLGRDTFAPAALELTADRDTQLAVPADAWAQVIAYRKDLYAAKGLPAPTSYDALRTASKELTQGKSFGITLATDASDPFTQQSFEAVALGNGCELVDDAGKPAMGSQACRGAFDLYADLVQHDSPTGTQSVDSTRATYFSGQAGAVIWSTFILDELAGLRKDALPTCEECKKDPTWLARNTGFVTALTGPDSTGPQGFGEIASWGIMTGANPKAVDYVTHMMSDAYVDTIKIAPEGKYPMRRGTTQEPTAYVNAWPSLPAGVDSKRPLTEVYGKETMQGLATAIGRMDRWAIRQGQGSLLGPVAAELVIPKAIAPMSTGVSGQESQSTAKDAVEEIWRSYR